MRKRSVWLAACAMATPVGAMAQTTAAPAAPPAAPTAPKDSQQPNNGDILIVAEAGDRQSIDRKSYVVKPGPAAEVATGIEVMKDLPSVSVDAAGQISLLGNGNVKILIDGRPVPDALSILRSMSAAQIARIEVITNPSAQFPADGTAGIINVITRRSSRDGLAGSIAGGVDTRGGGVARIAPTYTKGKWSLSTSPTFFRQRGPTEYRIERQQLTGAPDGISDRFEDATGEQSLKGFGARTQAVFRPDQKRSFSAAFSVSAVRVENDTFDTITPRTGEFAPFAQRGFAGYTTHAGNLALDYRAEGNRRGELLTAAVSGTLFSYDGDSAFRETALSGGPTSLLAIATGANDRLASAKLDYVRPLGKTEQLSLGASFDYRRRHLTSAAVGGGLLGPSRNTASDFAGDYRELAAYATFQTVIGGFKMLPGLRVQGRNYSLDDLNGDGPSRVDFFPSMFVERKIGKRVTTTLSYSRRISWPDIGDLSPVLRYQSPTSAVRGDPAFRPETTDAFEARVSFAGKIHSFDLTFYDRITHDSSDRLITLNPDGVVVTSPINAGTRLEQGIEAAFRGRIFTPLRYTLTGNLTAVSRDIGTLGNRQRDAQYRGKLQLDYTDGKAADPGFDQVTANLRYEGPVHQFQYSRSDFVDADVSWTHRFTKRLSLITSVVSMFGGVSYDSQNRTPFILDKRFDRQGGRTFRFMLTYQLSAAPQPQPPAAPPIPTLPGTP
ncbi:MAG: TonB-dependent receptor [Sphingomonas sp.]|uniref:TonB-dependent receptor plug domain-containing protein n=1 Tax=Sphingomonas sp. TaxID=28214 RepID=UPI00121D07E2|nr:TonB-dependent receptor [Sphingomonas sp.]THD34834.1 MAG: TonB-dependent receptor [Sphingomonas sp.]